MDVLHKKSTKKDCLQKKKNDYKFNSKQIWCIRLSVHAWQKIIYIYSWFIQHLLASHF